MTERFFGSKEEEPGAGAEETRPPLRSSGPSVDSRMIPEGCRMLCDLTSRGVWIAPWVGPGDELVVLVIDHQSRLVTDPVLIPKGADHVGIADELWALLEYTDISAPGVISQPPRSVAVVRPKGRELKLIS